MASAVSSINSIKESPSAFMRNTWARLSKLPGGKRLFTRMIGFFGPYAWSISPKVEEMRAGYARVRMPYRRAVQNHLGCVHAAALFNVAELSSIMLLGATVPDDARFIMAGANIDYLAKARSDVIAICECGEIDSSQRQEYEVPVRLEDENGEILARAQFRALVGPKRSKAV